ncbi:MAG: porin [Burkholderiaceae bacterium]|nr:porin [Burkholderiaceae bacterium]
MKLIRMHRLSLATSLALMALGAQAQSQVRLYGLLDVSAGSTKAPGGPSISAVDSGKLTTSYYGFSGSEDLGNGLSAQFKLESFLRADTGDQGRFTGDPYFARTSSVGLSHKDYGTLSLGRHTTALFASTLSFNAFGDSFGYSPSIRHYFGAGQNAVTGDTGWSDSIAYASPTWKGWRFGAMAALAEANPATTSNGRNWSVNLGYSQGPLAFAVVVQEVQKDGSATVQDTRAAQVNGSYDLGVAKVFGQYAKVKNEATGIHRDLVGLGARIPLGTGAVIAQWGKNAPDVGADRNTTSIGYLYPLSKQTELYAVAMHDKLDGSSAGHGYSAGMRLRF